MKIEVSEANYGKIMEVKEETKAESIDEVIGWLLDFWFSWRERSKGEISK